MKSTIRIGEKDYYYHLDRPLDITRTLKPNSTEQFGCFGAPKIEAKPSFAGTFELSIKAGSPVNSFDLFVNTHGRTTHTECLSHVKDDKLTITDSLQNYFFIASLVSVDVSENNQISAESLDLEEIHEQSSAVLIRTLPNDMSKQDFDYTGTNPAYISPALMQQLVDKDISHLIVDLPSVDPENDGGKVQAHKTFWGIPDKERHHTTITEMVYIPNEIKDGFYLVSIHPIKIELDAGISRVVLYKLWEDK